MEANVRESSHVPDKLITSFRSHLNCGLSEKLLKFFSEQNIFVARQTLVVKARRRKLNENETRNLRCELDLLMMFSRNVFCGATNPRRPPGILIACVSLAYLVAINPFGVSISAVSRCTVI